MTNNLFRFIVTYFDITENKNKGIAFERSSSDWTEAISVLSQLINLDKSTILGIEMKEVTSSHNN